ncbi:MAG: hypothetical protein AUI14_12370 [Actinobacteria bacterium 13_2_20CM_2_71_6]|nr:MAG: hypothetical protein AUI14_12370 [Actinobacteria bacterium 13_2_20CM_2_71_6]
MSVEGSWNVVIDSPIGKQRAAVELSTMDGVLHGIARDQRYGQEVALTDVVLDGNRLTWAQSITKPMRLNITFDVTVEGDEMTGRARAGRLPGSTVTGHRVGPDPSGTAR